MKTTFTLLAALAAASISAHAQGVVAITELTYKSLFGEYFELSNIADEDETGANDIDFAEEVGGNSGWRFQDNTGSLADGLDLSPLGVLKPGHSVIITEASEAAFKLVWFSEPGKVAGDFPGGVIPKVLGGNTINLGRSDTINIGQPTATLGVYQSAATLTYTDQGSGTSNGIRTEDIAGIPRTAFVGADNFSQWRPSGDEDGNIDPNASGSWKSGYAAFNGRAGSPGVLVTSTAP